MSEFNSEIVVSTLEQVLNILETKNIKYRFLGSVIIAAINGKLHRDLGDLDLIIDKEKKDILFIELQKLGYKRVGGMFAFARKYLEQLEHPKMLGIGYFYGAWLPDGSFRMGNNNVYLTIDSLALNETQYSLYNLKFIGIPKQIAATGVKSSATNPKQKKEIIILRDNNIQPLANKYIHVNFLGLKFDWVYYFAMGILNIIGPIRVKLGLAFDPWR